MNVGIILAAGAGSRFGCPKQLYVLDGKEMIVHSAEALLKKVDQLVIVTNAKCFKQIQTIFKSENVSVIKNKIDCRIASIRSGLDHIECCENVIIHDAARPFVKESHIQALLDSARNHLCSQFYFPLTNGLIKHGRKTKVVDRNQYFELVTPQIVDFRLARDLYNNQINSNECELIPILDRFKIGYNLIEGHWRDLRKINVKEDL